VYIFLIYGFIIGWEYDKVSKLPGESILYLLNLPVELPIIPIILIYFANQVGTPLNYEQIFLARIIASIAIWGFIGFTLYVLGRIWMRDRDPTIRILD